MDNFWEGMKNRNVGVSADAVAKFTALTGRPPTQDFIDWVNNTADMSFWGSRDKALLAHGNTLKKQADTIKAEAASLGMTMTDEDARKVREQVNPTGMTDPNRVNELMRNALSTRLQSETQTKQQTEIDKALHPEKYLDQATLDKYKSDAATQIKSILGRDATPEEAQFFASELAGGTSAYELQSMLKMTPEYLKTQAEAERAAMAQESAAAQEQLGQKMQWFSDEAFKRALPEILGQFMRSGRLNSSGIDSAVARAKADLVQKQQEYLANTAFQTAQQQAGYRREDFTSNAANAYNQYLRQSEPSYQQQFNLQNAGNYAQYQSPWETNRYNQSALQGYTQRDRELSDYERQQSDYANYLSQQRKADKEAAIYGLAGSLVGSAANVGLMKWAGAYK